VIYPATYNITILQNSTWQGVFRATQNRQSIETIVASGLAPLFKVPCHKLSAGDKVVVTGSGTLPCGVNQNEPYFVISSGLTNDFFYVSATASGTSISASGVASGVFYIAEPLDLTSYVIDSDIKGLIDLLQVGTFTPSLIDAVNGEFSLTLPPSGSAAIEPGDYNYDVSLTSPGGERYYWLTGLATVRRTYSRN
jgi:hypothetical protein